MLTPDSEYAAACASFRQRFSERLKPVLRLPQSVAEIEALNRSIDLTLTNLRELERHSVAISLFYDQVDSLPSREHSWREEYVQWLSRNASSNDGVPSNAHATEELTSNPNAVAVGQHLNQPVLPPPLHHQRQKLNELWQAFQSCGFEFGRDVGSRLAANTRLTGVSPLLYVGHKDRRKVLRLDVTLLRILRHQSELLQPSSTASDPFSSGLVASFAARSRQVRHIAAAWIEVYEALWIQISNAASAHPNKPLARSGSGYRPGELAQELDLSAEQLNRWAKRAGVKTPGRGKREFIYPTVDVLRILQTIVDGGASETTRSRATTMLNAEQSRATSTTSEPAE